MAAIQIPLIWIAAAIVFILLTIYATVFVKLYQARHDRDAFVTTVCILSLTILLATLCLFPVDIALVSSTTSSEGFKKSWATPAAIENILLSLKTIYYTLYSLDALFCLVLIPFAYFWYEEWEDEITTKQRIKSALKYSLFFLILFSLLLLIGFLLPAAATQPKPYPGHGGTPRDDWEFYKNLLFQNHGEKTLTFVLGILILLGTWLLTFYTFPGLALLPISLISPTTTPSSSTTAAHTQLAITHERLRALSLLPQSRLSNRDRRELESLQRQERTLTRRTRLSPLPSRLPAPIRITAGTLLLLLTILLITSMLLTGVDKLLHSPCGAKCGYILPTPHLLNPINSLFTLTARLFPMDYILVLFIIGLFFTASINGIGTFGLRVLFIKLFSLRRGGTKPQALLLTTVCLTLITLALNYSLTMFLLPSYSHFGSQKYCAATLGNLPGRIVAGHCPQEDLRACSETAPKGMCTPTVISTFVNRITMNWGGFVGVGVFWGQWVAIGLWLVCAVVGWWWKPRGVVEEEIVEEEEEEEERLLDAGRNEGYGAVGRSRG